MHIPKERERILPWLLLAGHGRSISRLPTHTQILRWPCRVCASQPVVASCNCVRHGRACR
jgi:hypothetical protein